ncbi:MAG: response regulator transcription factor [Spirochaetales bacterium]|nr:response regulator transcription factor [Spirochaetales bacterium]
MNILLVDDDVASLKVLSHFMKPYGTPVMCSNAVDALRIAMEAMKNNNPYELYMIDIMMPEINGHELLHEIRSIEREYKVNPPSKVVMVSALSDTENIMGAFGENCDAYIIKPVRMEKLSEQLAKIGIHAL